MRTSLIMLLSSIIVASCGGNFGDVKMQQGYITNAKGTYKARTLERYNPETKQIEKSIILGERVDDKWLPSPDAPLKSR